MFLGRSWACVLHIAHSLHRAVQPLTCKIAHTLLGLWPYMSHKYFFRLWLSEDFLELGFVFWGFYQPPRCRLLLPGCLASPPLTLFIFLPWGYAVCVLLEFALKHFIFFHKFNLVLFVLLVHGANCGKPVRFSGSYVVGMGSFQGMMWKQCLYCCLMFFPFFY